VAALARPAAAQDRSTPVPASTYGPPAAIRMPAAPAPTPPTAPPAQPAAQARTLYYQKPADAGAPSITLVKQERTPPRTGGDETINIQLTPPEPEQLFGHLDSEAALEERIRQESRSREEVDRHPNPVAFPPKPELSKVAFAGRSFSPLPVKVEPNYVCYSRLLFEQKSLERYGWDLGVMTPFLSGALFYKDVLALPYHVGSHPCKFYDCSTGYCLPGSPVPLLAYPPDLSVTGGLLEAGTIVALYAIFP
jgi:hypothetical protein